ncbi:protein white [Chrysoperla carnea]|uniref:protein white n=1 Tax=Chrysoperla carnea TaxID=189513 RepID=UPI001D06729E|nr:protein white [Chrysoperla carnea]
MTISEEHELLNNSGENQRSNYSSGGNGHAFQLESLLTESKPRYGSIGDSGGGDYAGDPENAFRHMDRITYTWYDMNVYGIIAKRAGRNRLISGITQKDPTPEMTPHIERKHILKGVHGIARPGELLAIMGSSGAGKTTLLNTLTFCSPASVIVSGTRCINGIPINNTSLRSMSAYVQQDDLFIGTLTVKEHLVFQALVRMDRNIPYKQRMQRVNEVLSELALLKCQNTTIGIPGRLRGISGGEMKRLSFAAEVLTNPPLMFCDEPTSGLDSFMAQNVVQVLKTLAQSGKTVVCTIHQPSSELYSMFDKLLLMAEGRVAFLGKPSEAYNFFSNLGATCPITYNPADYYVQLLAVVPNREDSCRQTIDMICDNYQTSDLGQRVTLEAAEAANNQYRFGGQTVMESMTERRSPYKANWIRQFRAVLWRSWISVIKEPILIKVRLLQSVLVSFLIGLIYFGQVLNQDGVMNINGAIFLFLTNMTFQNVFSVISVFCNELPVFLRENRNGMYRTDIYFLCKTLAEAPVFLAIPMIFAFICYYMIGLNPEQPRVFITAIIVALVANVAISFGYLISCISSGVSMALSIGPPVIIPFMLFGGFFLNTGSVPFYFKWLSYLSWFRYGNEALLINQWEGINEIDCTRSNYSCPQSGHVVLQMYNFEEQHLPWDIISLLGLICLFRFLAFLALLSKTYKGE